MTETFRPSRGEEWRAAITWTPTAGDDTPVVYPMSTAVMLSAECKADYVDTSWWFQMMLREPTWAERERAEIERRSIRRRAREAWMLLRLRVSDAIYPPWERDA